MHFEPQQVSPGDSLIWGKEALELTVRHALVHVLVIGAAIYLFAAQIWLSGFLFASIPVLFGLICVIAEAADNGESPLSNLRTKNIRVWGRLFMLGLYPYLLAIFGMALLSLLPLPVHSATESTTYTGSFSSGVIMLFAIYAWLVAGPFIWLAAPLLAVAELPMGVAYTQANQAFKLNGFVLVIPLILGVIAHLAFLLPVLVFPLIAIAGCMMYASYRHIWLGRGMNHPVAKRISNPAGAQAV